MYDIIITNKAFQELKKFPFKEQEQILKKLQEIKPNPFSFCKKLTQEKFWRLRVGKIRIFLDIVISHKKVFVLKIKKRSNAYN